MVKRLVRGKASTAITAPYLSGCRRSGDPAFYARVRTNKPNPDFPALPENRREMILPVQIVTALGSSLRYASPNDDGKSHPANRRKRCGRLNRAENWTCRSLFLSRLKLALNC